MNENSGKHQQLKHPDGNDDQVDFLGTQSCIIVSSVGEKDVPIVTDQCDCKCRRSNQHWTSQILGHLHQTVFTDTVEKKKNKILRFCSYFV